jgi:hypothetical protein
MWQKEVAQSPNPKLKLSALLLRKEMSNDYCNTNWIETDSGTEAHTHEPCATTPQQNG